MRKYIALLTIALLITAVYAHFGDAETYRLSGTINELTVPAVDSIEVIHSQLLLLLAGRTKLATTTEDLNQAAASYTLFTGTTSDVILESISLRNANVDCSDDAAFTGISIQTDDVTATTFISQANGINANLTEEATITWTGAAIIKVGTIIKMTIYGGAADATCEPDIMVTYRSTGTGTGTLAP